VTSLVEIFTQMSPGGPAARVDQLQAVTRNLWVLHRESDSGKFGYAQPAANSTLDQAHGKDSYDLSGGS
jgi:hypothetical protein